MKRNQSLTAVAALAIGTSFLCGRVASAQTATPTPVTTGSNQCSMGEHHHHRHGSPLAYLSKALNLTDDQKAKIQPILDQNAPQLKAIRQDAHAKTKAVRDSMEAQIRPLLTPEQQQQFDQLKTRLAEHHHGRFEHRIDHKVAKLTKALNLTSDQQTQVKATLEAARPQFKEIWKNASLSKDDKINQTKTVRADTRAKIRALLNPDQQQQFDALIAAHEAKHS